MTNLSQFNEAEIVANYFGSHIGMFVDVGCSAGVCLSNTYQLGLKDWHGLLVEASPVHFANLVQNYHHRGGFELLNAALWTERKLMKFNFNLGYYSSLIPKDEPGLFVGTYWVNTVIADDLAAIQPECDFLSLDIEQADVFVFPSLMRVYPKCRAVCVEHAKDEALKAKWKALFDVYKLHVLAETNENFIAVKK